MPGSARLGDPIAGGLHCHGHDHGPQPSPGRIREGAAKVFVDGRPAARAGDHGYSPKCCGGVGEIVLLPGQTKVYIEGRPAVGEGFATLHCGTAPGRIRSASRKVFIPE